MKKITFFFCLLTLGASFRAVAQSPWTRGKAGFYAQAAWQTIPGYTRIYDRNANSGKRPLEREISENTFQLYGEYGISRKTTALVALPIRFVTSGDRVSAAPTQLNAGSLSGLGNISLALRQNFLSGNIALSGQLKVDFPIDRTEDQTGLSTGYDALTVLPTLSVGQGFGRLYWFGYAGIGARGNIRNHFFHSGLETGIRWRRHWLILFSELSENTGSDVYAVSSGNLKTALFLPNPSYWAFGAKALIGFNRFFGGVLSAAGAFEGDLVPSQPAYSAGVYFKWD